MRKFSKVQDEAEINMTPMLDIVFIMLIFFIVTATFVKETGIEMVKPENNQQPPENQENENILIQVDNNNRIRINFRTIDIRQVRPNIERLFAENPEAAVVIQPGPDSFSGIIVQIYDAAIQAGVANIAVVDPAQN